VRASSEAVKTFSISFAESSFDESSYARAVAKFLGTDHHEERLSANLAANLVSEIGSWMDEPFSDPSLVPTYLLSRFTRKHVTVALSGDAGDENFGGYDRYRMHALVARWRPLRYGIATVAIVTAVLCLVNSRGKPSGIELLRNDAPAGVWSMPRWEQQGLLRPTTPERDEIRTLRYVQMHVPVDASIGIALQGNSFGFPYFGPRLTRHVVVVDEGDTIPGSITWLVTAPGRAPLGCPVAWRAARVGPFGWGVWQRTGPDSRCVTRTELSNDGGA